MHFPVNSIARVKARYAAPGLIYILYSYFVKVDITNSISELCPIDET